MRTITVRIRFGEPRQTGGGKASLGIEVLDGGIALEAGETAHMMSMFVPVGPDDVGLVIPMKVTICRAGEAPPPSREESPEEREKQLEVIAGARAELARARAAGEIPPTSAEANRILASMRGTLERAKKTGSPILDVIRLSVGGKKEE